MECAGNVDHNIITYPEHALAGPVALEVFAEDYREELDGVLRQGPADITVTYLKLYSFCRLRSGRILVPFSIRDEVDEVRFVIVLQPPARSITKRKTLGRIRAEYDTADVTKFYTLRDTAMERNGNSVCINNLRSLHWPFY